MANTYAVTDDDFEESWIKLAAAAGNVLAFLRQRRETATGAAEHGKTPVAVESAEGAAAEDE